MQLRKKLPKKIVNCQLPSTHSDSCALSHFEGQKIILYFYPKDNTSGCTQEALDFAKYTKAFKKHNAVVIGVSKDSLKSHEKFEEKYQLPFNLIADESKQLCELFDVLKEKSMYGKKYLGVERSTFLIDEQGVLIHEWRNVKVKGHVDEILNLLKTLG